jgi:hypothetical protein
MYLRADSTAIGLLQSQHGHIQQKQWTAQRQCTKTTYKNKNNNNNNSNNDDKNNNETISFKFRDTVPTGSLEVPTSNRVT